MIEDFSETSSYVFLQFHHSIIDGVSLVSSLKLISDNPDTKTIPPIKGADRKKSMIASIFFPFLILHFFYSQSGVKPVSNCVMDVKKETKELRKVLFEEFDQVQFTKSRRLFGCTFSTAINAILGQAAKEYYLRKGEPETENVIWIEQSCSLLPIAKKPRHGVHMTMVDVPVPAELDTKTAIEKTQKVLHDMLVDSYIV